MHELTLCQHLIEILEEQSQVQHYTRIKKIILTISTLSTIDFDALKFAFNIASQHTIAERALLEYQPIFGEAVCLNCHQSIAIQQWLDPCPLCGHEKLKIVKGNDIMIKELEVE
jgi:hydrogenase nickel incorporation protein HypA/HybF